MVDLDKGWEALAELDRSGEILKICGKTDELVTGGEILIKPLGEKTLAELELSRETFWEILNVPDADWEISAEFETGGETLVEIEIGGEIAELEIIGKRLVSLGIGVERGGRRVVVIFEDRETLEG